MFQAHKGTTAFGAIGAAIVLAHLILGPSVVPVGAVLLGLAIVATSGSALLIARRREERAHDR